MWRQLVRAAERRVAVSPKLQADIDFTIACPLLELHESLSSGGIGIDSSGGEGTRPTDLDVYRRVYD